LSSRSPIDRENIVDEANRTFFEGRIAGLTRGTGECFVELQVAVGVDALRCVLDAISNPNSE